MVQFTFCDSPFGPIRIGYEDGYIVSIRRCPAEDSSYSPSAPSDPGSVQLREYLLGVRKTFDLPIKPAGTSFQLAVWHALTEIPYGETRTYGQIAAAIGNPKASRAVGMACNRNPLWIVIPCHRVVGSNGSLTGYEGGLPMKRALLELEQQI